MRRFLFLCTQYLLPHHLLSTFMGWLSYRQAPWFKNPIIRLFVRYYRVNLKEAHHEQVDDYINFHDFFTRALKPGARSFDNLPQTLLSPCDGAVAQFGRINQGRCIQAKSQDYSVLSLTGRSFDAGEFMTIYLAPQDYHRVHMPYTGQLKRLSYIPGKLYSVNPMASESIPGLLTKNERVVLHFESDWGEWMLVMVGAMIVGSMYTTWEKTVRGKKPFDITYDTPLTFNKGDLLGYFHLGSTVVLICPNTLRWDRDLQNNARLWAGQVIGEQVI